MTHPTIGHTAASTLDTPFPLMAEPAAGWRLHSGVRLHRRGHDPQQLQITCAGQSWVVRNIEPDTLAWLGRLHHQLRAVVRPVGDQALALAQWLIDQGMLVPCRPERVLISGTASASIASRWQGRLQLAAAPLAHLPTRAELETHTGILVITGRAPDRALAWLARECGIPTVVVETGPGRCRVGGFLGSGACLSCVDLPEVSARPLLAQRLVAGTGRRWREETGPAPWMLDWAAAQVVVQLQRWQADPLAPSAWDWIDQQGRTGREVVEPHPLCCGHSQAASGAA